MWILVLNNKATQVSNIKVRFEKFVTFRDIRYQVTFEVRCVERFAAYRQVCCLEMPIGIK